MLVTPSNEFGLVIDSLGPDGTRPVITSMGAAITPGNNTYSAYVSVLAGAALTDDCYLLEINANNFGASAAAHDTIITIGFDPAGGTSFADAIVDLLTGQAGPPFSASGGQGGHSWVFPLFVKAGTSVGVKASQNSAAPSTGAVSVRYFCRPSRPELLRVGSRVVTYGSVPATSTGTAVTPGTTADGAYTQLGTVATGDAPWHWVMSCGFNQAVISPSGIAVCDLAIGSSTALNREAVQNQWFSYNTVEQTFGAFVGRNLQASPGDLVYGRMQMAGGVQSIVSMAAYGVI